MTGVSLRHLLSRLAGTGTRRFKRLVEGGQRSDIEQWVDTSRAR